MNDEYENSTIESEFSDIENNEQKDSNNTDNIDHNVKIIIAIIVISFLAIICFLVEYVSFERSISNEEKIESEDSSSITNASDEVYEKLLNDLEINIEGKWINDNSFKIYEEPQFQSSIFGELSEIYKVDISQYEELINCDAPKIKISISGDVSNVIMQNPVLYYGTNLQEPLEFVEVKEQKIEGNILYAEINKSGYYVIRDKESVQCSLPYYTLNNYTWINSNSYVISELDLEISAEEYMESFYFLCEEVGEDWNSLNNNIDNLLEMKVYYTVEPEDKHEYYNSFGYNFYRKNINKVGYIILSQNPLSPKIDFDAIQILYSVDGENPFIQAEYEIVKGGTRDEIRIIVKKSGFYAICYK